jgi:beta-N-acetylhexosaminidase
MSTALRRSVGELMIVGVSGKELTAVERAWLRVVRPAGVILFRRNIESAEQTRALLEAATSECSEIAFRFVDVEGGLVDRLKDALAPMPSAKAVYATHSRQLWHRHGALIGEAVAAFGFNTTLAPVVDLALPVSEPVMQTRSTTENPEEVAAYAAEFLAGLASKHVSGCAKHFPGLGGGTLDSHLATPSIERSLREMWQQDMIPYRRLAAQLPMVMVSHAAYPKTAGKNFPASISRWWITKILKEKIGYKGLVISDDLEMGGILNHACIEDAAVGSIEAGMHLIEICHSEELILRAFESLLSRAERSSGFRNLLVARAKEATQLRHRAIGKQIRPAISATGIAKLRERIKSFSVQVAARTKL